MQKKTFWIQLLVVTVIAAGTIIALDQFEKTQAYTSLGWVSLALFFFLSILMYNFGYQAAMSKNKHAFTNTVVGFTAGKMLLSAMLIVMYYSLMEPPSKWFVIPFFLIYLIYTIFETHFMLKLGKMESPKATD